MTQARQDAGAQIEAYIAAAPEAMRPALQRLRQVIKAAAPEAVEVFSYGVPGFKYLGRPLIYLGAARKHYAIYGPIAGAMDMMSAELEALDVAKGTIRFPPAEPPHEALVSAIVLARIKELDAAQAARKAKRSGNKKSAS
jgi:uncharacterized protein YdhG (YjbR/CyaY superfamily)